MKCSVRKLTIKYFVILGHAPVTSVSGLRLLHLNLKWSKLMEKSLAEICPESSP